ncbi:MAG: hypothetical protein QXD49_08715, partial [Archaeoglobaceae archaeon]
MSTSLGIPERIKEAIDKGAEIILVKVDAKNYVKVSLEIIKFFSSFAEGVYVTLNKPYFSLKRILGKEGVDLSKLYF